MTGEALAAAGGTLRSAAKYDFTELTMATTRENFPTAIRLLAEVVGEASLDQESIDAARTQLLRRIQTMDDDFEEASYQTLRSELYRSGPYGRPIYGYASTLNAITRRDLQQFYKRYYVQNNITVAVVGDIEPREASDAVLKAFGSLPTVVVPPAPVVPPETMRAPRIRLVQRAGANVQVMVGFLVPPTGPAAYPVLMVLDAIMGGGKRARLFSSLRERHAIGYVLGSFYQPLRFQSHLVGYVVTSPYRRNPQTGLPEPVADFAQARLLEPFRELAEKGPTDQELARAKTYLAGHYALRHERNADQAERLVWTDAIGLGIDFDQDLAAKISGVTKEQIQQASKQYFTNYALVVTMPEAQASGPMP
jgi:zinc protease